MDLAGVDAPEPGTVLMISCDEDGAMKMDRHVFAELGQKSRWTGRPATDHGEPFTGASLLKLIHKSKDRLREKARQ